MIFAGIGRSQNTHKQLKNVAFNGNTMKKSTTNCTTKLLRPIFSAVFLVTVETYQLWKSLPSKKRVVRQFILNLLSFDVFLLKILN